jgi:hypothetical protein
LARLEAIPQQTKRAALTQELMAARRASADNATAA